MEDVEYQRNLEEIVTARTEQLRQAVQTLERAYDITLSSGTQFDPAIVEAFLRVSDQRWQEIREQLESGKGLEQQ